MKLTLKDFEVAANISCFMGMITIILFGYFNMALFLSGLGGGLIGAFLLKR